MRDREGATDDGLDAEAGLPTWQEAAAHGSVEELVRWGREWFHVDLTDRDVVASLAANSVQRGGWRNNSELEDIHAGAYKRPGQKAPRGLSDAEMMRGNIETAQIIRTHLLKGGEWWYLDAQDDLFDFDRPYAGTPLTAHVTKKVLEQHRRQVKNNLWLFRCVERVVGWDRFLLGLALSDLADGIYFGSPLWPAQVDAWSDAADPAPERDVVEGLKDDPTTVPLDDLDAAIGSGIGFARGEERWHEEHCGDPAHRGGQEIASFLGLYSSLMGMPQSWVYATAIQRTQALGSDVSN